MPRKRGLYETLVTEALEEELAAVGERLQADVFAPAGVERQRVAGVRGAVRQPQHWLTATARSVIGGGFGGGPYYGLKTRIPDAIYVAAEGLGDNGQTGWANTGGRDIAFLRAPKRESQGVRSSETSSSGQPPFNASRRLCAWVNLLNPNVVEDALTAHESGTRRHHGGRSPEPDTAGFQQGVWRHKIQVMSDLDPQWTYPRLLPQLSASLVALAVSACSTPAGSVPDAADALGPIDGGVPDASLPLHHESYRASTGFASTQGANGWYYRQFDGVSYSEMTWDATANRWQGSDPFCIVGPSWMHPDAHQAVREWKAPFDGTVTIKGSLDRPSVDGDGTRTRITKNGIQIWPSIDWQIVSPRFVARHVLTAQVRVGDSIGFHIDRNGDESYDTTDWDPVITYNTPPSFTLDKSEIVMDPGTLDAMGMQTMDVSLSTVPRPGGGNLWFHSERFGSDHQKFSGSLDHPGTTLLFEKTAADYFKSNPSGADGQWWLTNLFKASDGGVLGFVHVEKSGGADRYRLGLAYSTDSGDSWTYLGHVIGQYSDPDGANVSGTPYFVKDGFFYIYFADMSPAGGIAAVARAPVDEVLAAARQGTTSPWRKYLNGSWSGEGLGGMASGLALPTVNLHSDAAYSTTKRIYILTGYNHGPGRGVWIAFSQDGVTYSQGEWLQQSDDPNNQTLSPYITIVNDDGTDNALVGDSFYAYWAFAPRYTELGNGNLRYLVRQRVTLIAP